MKTLLKSFFIWLALDIALSFLLSNLLSIPVWKGVVFSIAICIFMYILNTLIIVLNNVNK